MDFSIGVPVFVKVKFGNPFSTASGRKGYKTSVVLVSKGGVISTKLLRIFPASDNLTKWKESRPCRVFLFSIKLWFISSFIMLMIRGLSTFDASVLII